MTSHLPPNQALKEAVRAIGSQSKMGRLVGVTQQAVYRWLRDGRALPAEHVLEVEAATGISKHDLRPDIYPRPDEAQAASNSMEPAR